MTPDGYRMSGGQTNHANISGEFVTYKFTNLDCAD